MQNKHRALAALLALSLCAAGTTVAQAQEQRSANLLQILLYIKAKQQIQNSKQPVRNAKVRVPKAETSAAQVRDSKLLAASNGTNRVFRAQALY